MSECFEVIEVRQKIQEFLCVLLCMCCFRNFEGRELKIKMILGLNQGAPKLCNFRNSAECINIAVAESEKCVIFEKGSKFVVKYAAARSKTRPHIARSGCIFHHNFSCVFGKMLPHFQ